MPWRALAVHERHHRDTFTSIRTSESALSRCMVLLQLVTLILEVLDQLAAHNPGVHRGFPTDHSVPMCSTGDKESGNGPTHQPRSLLQVERYRGLHVLRDLLTTTLCVNAIGTGALHSYEVQGKPIHNFASASVLARCWSKFT